MKTELLKHRVGFKTTTGGLSAHSSKPVDSPKRPPSIRSTSYLRASRNTKSVMCGFPISSKLNEQYTTPFGHISFVFPTLP